MLHRRPWRYRAGLGRRLPAGEKASLERRRLEDEASQRKAMLVSHELAVAEAEQLAVAAAREAPLMDLSALEDRKQERQFRHSNLVAEREALASSQLGSLHFMLGQAIIASGSSVSKVMREWDKNHDGELSRLEFKKAIRLTLTLKVSNEQINSLFDSFDDDKGTPCCPATRVCRTLIASATEPQTVSETQYVRMRGFTLPCVRFSGAQMAHCSFPSSSQPSSWCLRIVVGSARRENESQWTWTCVQNMSPPSMLA